MNAFSCAASYDCGPAPSPRSVTRGASPGRPRPPTPSPSPCPPRRERPARPWWRRRSSAARSGCAPDAGAGEPRDRPGVAHQRGDSVDPSGAAYQNLGMETRAGQQRRSDAVLGGGREGTGHLRQQVGKGGPPAGAGRCPPGRVAGRCSPRAASRPKWTTPCRWRRADSRGRAGRRHVPASPDRGSACVKDVRRSPTDHTLSRALTTLGIEEDGQVDTSHESQPRHHEHAMVTKSPQAEHPALAAFRAAPH